MPASLRHLLALALSASLSQAAEWHVSVTGDDSAAGTTAAPFRTIARGVSAAQPGDTVLLHDGTYRETVSPPRDGRADAPITLKNAPGATPIISALDLVTGPWTAEPDGSFHAPAPTAPLLAAGLDQVFIDGEMQPEARFPNQQSRSPMQRDGMAVRVDSHFTITSPALAKHPAGFFAGARFIGTIHPAWTAQNALVADSAGDALTIAPDSVSTPWWPNKARSGNVVDADADYKTTSSAGEGFLYGTRKLLDADGEWLIARAATGDTLTLRPPGGRAPASLRIERKTRPWTLDLNGRSHWIISGLRLEGGAARLNGTGLVLERSELRHPSHFLIFKKGFGSNGDQPFGSGILVQGQGNIVRHCVIRDSAGSGIQLAGRGHLVTRNLIENIDYSGTYGAGVALQGRAHRVEFNTIRNTGRDCISIGGGEHRILYNDLSRSGVLAMDGGMIYTYGQNGAGTEIAYNWVHESGNPADQKSRGIYIDNYSRGFVIHHNVIQNLGRLPDKNKGIHVGAPSQDIAIYHNTLLGVLPPGVATYSKFPLSNTDPSFWTAENHRLSFTFQNNFYLPASTAPQSVLENPAAGDFRPRIGSPATDPARHENVIRWTTHNGKTGVPPGFVLYLQTPSLPFRYEEATGEGIVLPGINDHFTGSAPDNGAYERGRPLWHPGQNGETTGAPSR